MRTKVTSEKKKEKGWMFQQRLQRGGGKDVAFKSLSSVAAMLHEAFSQY